MKKITKDNIKDVFQSKMMSIETAELKGYEWITSLFADSSGFGSPSEQALTQEQLEMKLLELAERHKTIYTSIVNAGQFQVYIGVFVKDTKNKKSRVIKNNTLEITEKDKRIIRLYDTNILTFEPNKLTIDNGGFATKTTKERINEFLPNHLQVIQKNFQWYLVNSIDNTTTEFTNNITVKQ